MNKTDLIEYIAENSDGEINKKLATKAVDLHWEAIEHALQNGDKVQLVGTITIEPVKRSARKGYNPQTNEEIEIPESMGVKAKAGKSLDRAVQDLDMSKFTKVKKAKKA